MRKKWPDLDVARERQILEAYGVGMGCREVGRLLSVNERQVEWFLRYCGLLRNRGEAQRARAAWLREVLAK